MRHEKDAAGVETSAQPTAMLAMPGGGGGGPRHIPDQAAPLEHDSAGMGSTDQPRGHFGPEAQPRGRKVLDGPAAAPGAAGQASREEGRQSSLRADASHTGGNRVGLWWQQ